jgi:hypothetical protein
MNSISRVAMALALTVLAAAVAEADTINHSGGFASHGDLTANGSAQFVGTFARLTDGGFTEAGSIFSNTPIRVANFTTEFTFLIGSSGTPVADGMTFCIHGNAPTALGTFGGDLGYRGIPKSVAIKFDTFDNDGEGQDSTGVFSGGRVPSVAQESGDVLIGLANTGIDLASQHVFDAVLSYHGGLLTIEITDTETGTSFSQTLSVDIPSKVGGATAYVGFTGGTGGLSAIQDIRTWTFQGGL